jgi:hypothetical protein
VNLFVSYTRRDGTITNNMLIQLNNYLGSVCTPFIHAVEESKLKNQQIAVIKALIKSHAILLVESPEIMKSKWVKLELFIARLLLLPIIRLNHQDINEIMHNESLNADPHHGGFSNNLGRLSKITASYKAGR